MRVLAAVHGAWSCEELESVGVSEYSFLVWCWSVSTYRPSWSAVEWNGKREVTVGS